ncbi:hypothetical protein [Halocynthiibacter sp.]|uniref:hypothetical protein n=1 Tax=Halocynthiibacter sp. TaxID=1979210 RepID=UPI003C6B9524
MKNDWILDVLTDLKSFALQNGLNALSEQLDDTTLIAASELANQGRGEWNQTFGNINSPGKVDRFSSTGSNA